MRVARGGAGNLVITKYQWKCANARWKENPGMFPQEASHWGNIKNGQ